MAAAKPFKVGYIERPIDPAFLAVIAPTSTIKMVSVSRSLPDAEAAKQLGACQVYYIGASRQELPEQWHVTRDFLKRCPGIIVVVSQGAGFDPVDADACTEAGIPVINQAGGNASGVSEHAIGMMLGLLKRMPEAALALHKGTAGNRNSLIGGELGTRTVGIVGLGNTGGRTANLAKAFGSRVLAYDPYVDAASMAKQGVEKVDLDQLLADSDVISLHCPRDADTVDMFGAKQFAAMRKGAIFVSTARGGIHDEVALYEALVSGHLAGAGLDVWEQEPPPAEHPLLTLPTVIASSHLAGVTRESRANVGRMAAEAIIAASKGEALPRMVNPQTQAAFNERWAKL